MSSPLTHPKPITFSVPVGASVPAAPDAAAPEAPGVGVLPLLHAAAARTNASSVGMKAARRLAMDSSSDGHATAAGHPVQARMSTRQVWSRGGREMVGLLLFVVAPSRNRDERGLAKLSQR